MPAVMVRPSCHIQDVGSGDCDIRGDENLVRGDHVNDKRDVVPTLAMLHRLMLG